MIESLTNDTGMPISIQTRRDGEPGPRIRRGNNYDRYSTCDPVYQVCPRVGPRLERRLVGEYFPDGDQLLSPDYFANYFIHIFSSCAMKSGWKLTNDQPWAYA